MKNQLQLIALVSILMVIGGCSPQLKALNVVPKPRR